MNFRRFIFAAIQLAVLFCQASAREKNTDKQIAFISDAHVMDVVGHPEFVRSQEAQVLSTRLFNENYFALCAALDDCGRKGIKMVVLPGDLTDNGQPINQSCVRDILNKYREKYRMSFFVCFGNHDPARPFGFDFITRDYLSADGSRTTISSKPIQDAQYNPDMRGSTIEEQIECYAHFGFMPQQDYRFWATPFSSYSYDNYSFTKAIDEAKIQKRQYSLNESLMAFDTSYLVEPTDGLWLLSLDGSVYLPKGMNNGTMEYQPSELGYNNIIGNRDHLIRWTKHIVEEAERRGKALVTFCHYPLVDFNDGAGEFIAKSWGEKKFDLHRTPTESITEAMMNAGLQLHFAGHLHVNDTGIKTDNGKQLINVQVPSTGLFMPAYKILTINDNKHFDIETVVLDSVPDFDTLFPLYQKEYDYDLAHGKQPVWSIETLQSKSYIEFCDWHFRDLTRLRFIPRDLPEVLRKGIIGKNGAEILHSINPKAKAIEKMSHWSGFDLILDLYRLRYAGGLSRRFITEERLKQYDILFDAAKASAKNSEFITQIRSLGDMFNCFLNEEPSDNFSINLK